MSSPLRPRHQPVDALHAGLAAALVVGDAADHVDAEVKRLVDQALPVRKAQQPVLGERDQLHVDQPFFANLEQGA